MKYDQIDMTQKLLEIHEKIYIAEQSNANQQLDLVLDSLDAISKSCHKILEGIKQDGI